LTFDLIKRLFQGVAVKGIPVKGIDRQNPVFDGTGDHGHLAAELVALVGLALGDAFHLRGMNTVDFVGVVPLLGEDLLRKSQQAGKILIGNLALAPDVPDDPAQESLQLPSLLSCSLELAGMGVAALLDEGLLAQPLVVLPEIDVSLLSSSNQGSSGLLIKPGIIGKGDGFFLNRRIVVDSFHTT